MSALSTVWAVEIQERVMGLWYPDVQSTRDTCFVRAWRAFGSREDAETYMAELVTLGWWPERLRVTEWTVPAVHDGWVRVADVQQHLHRVEEVRS